MRERHPAHPRPRGGFTLIELLVVIVILGLLVGLLVPAVMRAVGTARDAAVSSEIQGLGQALAAFKNQYGDYPPSRLVCSENGKYDAATLGAMNSLAPRTLSALRRFWPKMDLRTDGSAPAIPGVFYDFNGDGTNQGATGQSGPYVLNGPECLVLFLGGVPTDLPTGGPNGGHAWGVTGFSKNPANPFQNAEKTNNRTAPFHEFVSSRLVDYPFDFTNGVGAPFVAATGRFGGFPCFLDSLGGTYDPSSGMIQCYAYFSAYGGAGYDPSDCDMAELDQSNGTVKMIGGFVSNNAPAASAANGGLTLASGRAIQSPSPNPYTNSPPIPTLDTPPGNPDTATRKPRVWQNAQTYQIISSGRDRTFGIGGQYLAASDSKLPWVTATAGYVKDSLQTVQANAAATGASLGNNVRSVESDNLTNFSQGKLD